METPSDNGRDYQALRKKLLASRSLFVDPEFPPDVKSLNPTGKLSRQLSQIGRVEWKRATQITQFPKFISATASRSDLDQGSLGNCWFVAAASLLVNGPKQHFERVVPPDQGFDKDYAGIFHFKFWWYGHWKEVIIDDYLPTDGRRLLFTFNVEEPDELWGALLEKAYAKLRGSYEALEGGKLTDAMVDLTGGIAETIFLGKDYEIPKNLYELLWKSSQMHSLIGGSIYLPEGSSHPEERRSNGLYMGHAYSITALSEVPLNGRKYRLLRIRNPWGRKEWNGAWSDTSPEIRKLPRELKVKLNITVDDDGEFWMSYEDFIANFDECQMCHLQPDGVNQELSNLTNKKNWSVTMYHDAWLKGVTAGGCGNPPNQDLYWRNPQFQVHLAETDATDGHKLCTMMVSLMEKERPDVESKVAVGFDVYQVDSRQRRPLDGKSLPRSALIHREGTGTYQHYREVARRFQLAPGYYVIIPSTFNPHQEADFLLRVYTEKEVESEVMDEHGSPTPPPRPIGDPLEALYRKHAGEDGRMDFRELETFLMDASLTVLEDKISFGKEACRSLLSLMDRNHSGYVTFSEAKDIVRQIKAYTTVFRQFDVNRSNNADAIELETMFRRLGFPVSRTVLASIVRRYGGRDAKIELEDFIVVMCKLVVMYDIFKEKHLKTGGQTDVAHFSRNEFLQYTFC